MKTIALALGFLLIFTGSSGFTDDSVKQVGKESEKEQSESGKPKTSEEESKKKTKTDPEKKPDSKKKEEEEKPKKELVGTHIEVDPIRIPLGNQGKIKTMAMDQDGNLLLGISWVPKGTKPRKPPAEDPPAEKDSDEDKKPESKEKPESEKDKSSKILTMEEIRKLPPAERRRAMMERRKKMKGRGGKKKKKFDPFEGLYHFAIKVVSPEGKVLSSLTMEEGLEPLIIHGAADGVMYVAGGGKLAAFRNGSRIKMIDTKKIAGDKALLSGMVVDEDPSGKQHIFVAFGTGRSLRATEDIFRFDRGFVKPKKIIEEQFGCCGHLDLEVRDGELLVAENSRHRVNRYDFDGKLIERWGERDRTNIEGFAACCNPCNTDFGADGVLYTAESGVGRVKKFSQKGKFLGFVGYIDTTEYDKGSGLASQSCYIPIEVASDEERIYVMDVREHIIRVLEKRRGDSAKVALIK